MRAGAGSGGAGSGAARCMCVLGGGHLTLLAAVGRGLALGAPMERRRQRLAARGVAALEGHKQSFVLIFLFSRKRSSLSVTRRQIRR